ncbi:MAG TPA: Gx transporter family protein, partial [Clostridiales bacterium]|nr:Gx transporter family protein [Clostridiales bacterium]
MSKKLVAAQKTALFGILSAQALLLSFLEGLLPSFFPVQGIKLGLSNIVTMYCVSSPGISYALAVTLFKAFFALITRGAVASLLSLSGG